ncbi:hypothetical protein SLS62_010842 [Diatrype stigma]|uniref:Uncharacterized protein n=1 Tax=Diatrype stigma TaxID=117547 RepID=A0AAN9U7U2_9PEZI
MRYPPHIIAAALAVTASHVVATPTAEGAAAPTATEAPPAAFRTPLAKGAAAANTQPPFPIPSEYLAAAAGGWAAASASGSGAIVTSVLMTAPSGGVAVGTGGAAVGSGGATSPSTTAAGEGNGVGVTQVPVPVSGATRCSSGSAAVAFGVAVGGVSWAGWFLL